MNKTVNINLAGIFFHIDEDAYAKLQHYLDAIKRSFANTQGKDEIIADIEARIAELFNEKKKDDRQVIGIKEVEEVITIMGQPEDYMVDEEIFEDEPVHTKTTKSPGKQLFRDTEHSYVGGVSSGLGHYLGIDFIWVRLLWILLTIFSSGAFILIYIALWIFVPEAKTTADKLAMRGEEVTISNIEKKIREGFDNVTGKVKDVDYQKYGNQAKSGATSAATAIGDVIAFILKVFVKLIGIILILLAGASLIGLFIGLVTVGTFGLIDAP
ncbi:phage shock protein C (PspC) family protein [Salegentibacter salinarum]|nr:PspC domain-containing protein [Salegentibacter salinarum]SKB94396.1 phage shock protein C (PspC) family protein [Salegentibacter salinarum]